MPQVKEYSEIDFLSDLSSIVEQKPAASQRDIGSCIGISVGVVNSLIRKCMERGWVACRNMNFSKLQYLITPSGIAALTKRSIAFMRRNFTELERYRSNMDRHLKNAKSCGKTVCILCGKSSLDTLIEEGCRKYDLKFVYERDGIPCKRTDGHETFVILGEDLADGDSENLAVDYNLPASIFALVV